MIARPGSSIDRRVRFGIIATGAVSLTAWGVLQLVSPPVSIPWSAEMRAAADRMQLAIAAVQEHCERTGITIDESLDPNRTCLIGPESTPLFTTLGHLEAKRTTTNPDMAALMVHLLYQAGAFEGDTIAVGPSASFPALLIATQAAAEVLGVHPIIILSLGASSYGATRPDFNLLDLHELLTAQGILTTDPVAVSLGGEGDVGAEFDPSVKEELVRQIEASRVPLVSGPDLRASVSQRMGFYFGPAANGRVSVFVNVGGGDANIGTSPMVLDVSPGLHTSLELPPETQRGVLFEMAARGVPVIHLLNVRGLAARYGIPWDPIPLPEPGATRIHDGESTHTSAFWLIGAFYLVSLGGIAVLSRARRT